MSDFYAVGKSVSRVDAVVKVTGEAGYTADVMLPGMLCGIAKRSPHSHARIVRIDTSRAEALPGVKAVITANDVPDILLGLKLRDAPILARGEVRFTGEKVAAVAAVDEETALEALDLIDVEYEELPALTNVNEAMKPGALLVHEKIESYSGLPKPVKQTNVFYHETFSKGYSRLCRRRAGRSILSRRRCSSCYRNRTRPRYRGRHVWSPTRCPSGRGN
jgi:CO/xanthine dehydrogenase Mo-binding subunit